METTTFKNYLIENLLNCKSDLVAVEELQIPQQLQTKDIIQAPDYGEVKKMNYMLLSLQTCYLSSTYGLNEKDKERIEEKVHKFINDFFVRRINNPHEGATTVQNLISGIKKLIREID